MKTPYDFKMIEPKWQRRWDDEGVFYTSRDIDTLKQKPKFYILDMFPYPSGAGLHVGHPRGYTATDVVARMKRMMGFNVLHPMGWDAFGLPAERAAMRDGIHPEAITKTNIANFKKQIQSLGLSYDWTREINTSSPDYYRWTQWIFIQLYNRGLAYMDEVAVNWCPKMGTVLANEEVQDGKYIETGDPVEQRKMKQWVLRITEYADRLLEDLDKVNWPENLKEMQRNWIGKQVAEDGTTTYRLKDWLFSRQRYWGEPFPILHSEDGQTVLMDDAELPIVLPLIDEYRPTDDGKPPLARATEWCKVQIDGKNYFRETNTMPQWAGSCWYYLRFIDPENINAPFSKEIADYWLPVDLYVGGAEHAVSHLLYARFWHKVLFDCGLLSTDEPFEKVFNQGMILAKSYRDSDGKYYSPGDINLYDADNPCVKESGVPVSSQVEKMSKSKLNVINPDDVVEQYGADTLRLYELYMGPLDQNNTWDTSSISGVHKFINRVWKLITEKPHVDTDKYALYKAYHKMIKKVSADTEALKFNTAISEMFIFVNAAIVEPGLPKEIAEGFLKILTPYIPHVAEELWEIMGNIGFISAETWPSHDESVCSDTSVRTIVIQVNGKKRAEIAVEAGSDAVLAAQACANVKKYIDGNTIVKTIVVPDKLINFVVK